MSSADDSDDNMPEVGPWWVAPWAEAVRGPGATVDLTRAALYLSAHGSALITSAADIGTSLERLDRCSEQASIAHEGNRPFDVWHRLCFSTLRLSGNHSDYHDARNSYLPDVLVRRVGLPITLAVLMIELGSRQGIDCWGVGMPGHFLIGARPELTDVEPVYIDAFAGGTVLDEAGCASIFDRMFGPEREWTADLLRPTDPHAILIRMLANLKQQAARRRDLLTLCDLARLRWFLPALSLNEGRELVRLCAAVGALDEAPIWMERLARRFGPYKDEATDRRILTAAMN